MPRLDISSATPEQKKDLLKYAADFYKAEIDNFWKRSVFFWGFIAVAFVAYGTLYEKADGTPAQLVTCFGLVCSTAWTLINRGSKYWYEAWEQKVASIEKEALGAPLFSNVEILVRSGWWGAARYSAAKITIGFSDFVVLTWLVLGLRTLPIYGHISENCYMLLVIAGTFSFIAALLVGCRSASREKFPSPQSN